MPVDPTTDPDFMKAPPHEQMAYLSQTDPEFAKADPRDQLGYLMHIRGLGSVQGPQAPSVNMQEMAGTNSLALPAHGVGSLGPGQPEATPGMAAAGATGLALGAGAVGGSAALPYIQAAARAHPLVTQLLGMAAISESRKIPVVGKFIPPYAEMAPMLLGGAKPEPTGPPARIPTPSNYKGPYESPVVEPTSIPPVSGYKGPYEPPAIESTPSAPIPPIRGMKAPYQTPVPTPGPSASVPAVKGFKGPYEAEPAPYVAPPPVKYSIADIKAKAASAEEARVAAERAPAQTFASKQPASEPTTQPPFPGPKNYEVMKGQDPFTHTNAPQEWLSPKEYSSRIKQYGFDPNSQTISVMFKRGDVYHFKATQQMFNLMKNSSSEGEFLSQIEKMQPGLAGRKVGTVSLGGKQ